VRSVTADTLSDAKKLLGAFLAEVQSGELARKEAEIAALSALPSFGEWTDIYLNEYMRCDGDETSTRHTYSAAFKHLSEELRAWKLSDLTDDMLHNWLRALRQRGRRTAHGTPGLSYNTIALIRAAVSSCLSKAVKRKLIRLNPTPKMSDLNMGDGASASDRARRAALSAAQIGAIQAQITDPDLLLWLRVLGATRLRPGEATALTWGDIDFARHVIHVRHSAKRGTVWGQGRLGTTKTKKSVRDVPPRPHGRLATGANAN
jgi:integrase